jgi:hypothetical protein
VGAIGGGGRGRTGPDGAKRWGAHGEGGIWGLDRGGIKCRDQGKGDRW